MRRRSFRRRSRSSIANRFWKNRRGRRLAGRRGMFY